MKESSKKQATVVKRHGYKGSGFVFYFVSCYDREALKEFALRHPGNERFFENGNLPFGLSYCSKADVLEGVIPEAKGTELWAGYMLVARTDKKYPLSTRDVRRHWHHEIGHMVEFFCNWHARMVDDMPELSNECYTEAAAYCTEFLEECLDELFGTWSTPPMSGMPLLFPWTDAGQQMIKEEERTSK